MYLHNLDEIMAEARIARLDDNAGYVLAWFGGHGVHAYTGRAYGRYAGKEVAFWNVGDFAQNDADEADVLRSMSDRMENADYIDFC